MKAVHLFLTFSALLLILSFTVIKTKTANITICNPINLSYRFCLDKPSRREAADPVIVLFKDEYYLFASKSGGYWHSTDLVNWDFITSAELPFEDYAPAVVAIKDTLYFMASGSAPVSIFKTSEPKSGKWKIANAAFPIGMTDPDLFLDDDGRLYFYYGCSDNAPIHAVELDLVTLNPKSKPVDCFNSNSDKYGWEQTGDNNNKTDRPWIEGSWMTKHNGKYYLQYAVPGTQYKSYCDGVYVADNPLGPFKVAAHNPFSFKPGGFVAGAGHSCTFQDKYGNYWHITTMTISQKHMFERRLGLFPVFIDNDGTFYTYTGFGDFPFSIPERKINGPDELFPHWMLLSYKKPVEVSSELQGYPKIQAVDEEIRTYWSAKTGNKGEWISIDLQKESVINSVQINFAENQTQLFNRSSKIYYQYLLEYSDDNKTWKQLVDKTKNTTDIPHDYIQLTTPLKARFIRLTNYHVPDGTFALSGFRIFGNAQGKKPEAVRSLSVRRTQTDKREVRIKWEKSNDATGFNIRYGTQKDKLYNNYEVLETDSLTIRSLNSELKYYFVIDSFNENGVAKGNTIVMVN
jgi:xylan 1,4-beta-xylosidase